MICGIDQINTTGKTVFVRVDLNAPIDNGSITEPHRIDSSLPTLRLILKEAKKVIVASHLGRPNGKQDLKYSLGPVRAYLEKSLEQAVVLAPDCVGLPVQELAHDPNSQIVLLENLRFHVEEEKND